MALNWDNSTATGHDDIVRETFETVCTLLWVAVPKIGASTRRALQCMKSDDRLEIRWEGKEWNLLQIEFVPESQERQATIHMESRQAGKPDIYKAVIQPGTARTFFLQSTGTSKEVDFTDVVDAILVPALYEIG